MPGRWRPLTARAGRFVVLVALLALGTVPPLALAGGASSAAGNGQLRVAHLGSDGQPLDVLVDGERLYAGLAFGQHTEYLVLPAGWHGVLLVPANEPPPAYAAAQELEVRAGEFATLLLLPAPAPPLVLRDESWAATGGPARVRLVHAAVDTAPAALVIGPQAVVVREQSFGGASEYQDAPTGTLPLVVRLSDADLALASIPDATLVPDYAYTFILLRLTERAEAWVVVPLVDAYPPSRVLGRAA